MDDRLFLATLNEDVSRLKKGCCFVGFDGFTDEILQAVRLRTSPTNYQPMESMTELGHLINGAAGKSCNVELVLCRTKIGGQAPILTRALVEGGHHITLVGLLGAETIEPVFDPLADCAHLISLGPSSHTLAVEFPDGKVMLGQHTSVHDVTWEALLAHIPLSRLIEMHESVDLFVSGNWTMLTGTNGIWRGFAHQVQPHLSKRLRWMYVDFADPAKRCDADLREGLELLRQLSNCYQVVLGLNVAEAARLGLMSGLQAADDRESLTRLAHELRNAWGVSQVVIHAVDFAVADSQDGQACVDGPGSKPILTTGGGDNFNAGYCHALLNGCTLTQSLLMGVAVSGFYVSHGQSPSMQELARFLRLWHDHPHGLSTAISVQGTS